MSFAKAMSEGIPVVFTGKGRVPEVFYMVGKEAEALATLESLKLVKLVVVPPKAVKPKGR